MKDKLFGVGDVVNVMKRNSTDDFFQHDFVGTVREIKNDCYTVEDQDGDCWDVNEEQMRFNTDDIMND